LKGETGKMEGGDAEMEKREMGDEGTV